MYIIVYIVYDQIILVIYIMRHTPRAHHHTAAAASDTTTPQPFIITRPLHTEWF